MFRWWSRKASQRRRHLTWVLKAEKNFVGTCFLKVKAEHKRKTTEKNAQWDIASRMLSVKNSLISDNGRLWLSFWEMRQIKHDLCFQKAVLEACEGWYVKRKASNISCWDSTSQLFKGSLNMVSLPTFMIVLHDQEPWNCGHSNIISSHIPASPLEEHNVIIKRKIILVCLSYTECKFFPGHPFNTWHIFTLSLWLSVHLSLLICCHCFFQTVNKVLLKKRVVDDKYGLLLSLYKISLTSV